jgi:hypothetical protein
MVDVAAAPRQGTDAKWEYQESKPVIKYPINECAIQDF